MVFWLSCELAEVDPTGNPRIHRRLRLRVESARIPLNAGPKCKADSVAAALPGLALLRKQDSEYIRRLIH